MKHYYLDLTLKGIEHRGYQMFSLAEGTTLFHKIVDKLHGEGDICCLKDGSLLYEDDICTVQLLGADEEIDMNNFKWFMEGHEHVYLENQITQ